MFEHTFPDVTRLDALRLERLEKLRAAGTIHYKTAPAPWQMRQCALQLWAFTTLVQAEDRYEHEGPWLSRFPQRGVAQFLSGTYFLDPTGLARTLDGLIWHMLSLNHFNREALVFDLQMLTGFDSGLDTLEGEIKAVISGAHPHAAFLKDLVGDPSWHALILEEVQAARRGEFRPTDPEDNLQGMVDLFLSYPATPAETFADPVLVRRLLGYAAKTGTNLLKALAGQGEVHESVERRQASQEAADRLH